MSSESLEDRIGSLDSEGQLGLFTFLFGLKNKAQTQNPYEAAFSKNIAWKGVMQYDLNTV